MVQNIMMEEMGIDIREGRAKKLIYRRVVRKLYYVR